MLKMVRWAVPLLVVFGIVIGHAGQKIGAKQNPRFDKKELYKPVVDGQLNGVTFGTKGAPLPDGWWNTKRTAGGVGVYTGLSSFYDLQSNGGSHRFLEIDTTRPGHMHATFITCEDSGNSGYPNRRVSYARSTDNGVTWVDQQETPLANRAGFPSLDIYRGSAAYGWPVVASHFGDPVIADMVIGDISGGAPSFIDVVDPTQPGVGTAIWPNVACAYDGSINMHASVNSTTNQPLNFYGRVLPDLSAWGPDLTTMPNVYGGSARSAIAAAPNGKVGTVGLDDSLDGLWILESTDNGVTWPGSATPASVAGRVSGGDSLYVNWHWDIMYTAGNERYMAFSTSTDPDAGDDLKGRIEFHSAGTGFVDAVANDPLLWNNNASGVRGLSVGAPSIGISGSKILIAFVGFLAATPNDPVSGGSEGDIFLVQSTDGGATWSQPANITQTSTVDERFVSISRWNEDGYANLVWQEDDLAASSLDGAGYNRAYQVFAKVDVANLFPADDITALTVNFPKPGHGVLEGTKIAPRATFRNTGLAGQTSIPVRMEVLDNTPAVIFTSNKTIASLASGATQEVLFDSIPSTLALGQYVIRAEALLPGDLRPLNDTAYTSIIVFPKVSVSAPTPGTRHSYHTGWDSPAPDGFNAGWYVASDAGAIDWVLGTPAKTQISRAHSGTNAWVTKLSGIYTSNAEPYLASPGFDMTALSGNVTVEFFHNFQIEDDWDGAAFVYSTDGGTTWRVADSALGSGPNFNTSISTGWYNESIDLNPTLWQYGLLRWAGAETDSTSPGSDAYENNNDGWIRSSTVLPIGGLSDVRFRFAFKADAAVAFEGWAIDDFSFGPTTGSSSVSIAANWNMISSPVDASNDSVQALYPNSTFPYAFSFGATGYTQDYTMDNGAGYWAKFPGAETAIVSGSPVFTYDVPVNAAWNMVGSVSSTIDTADIIDEPAGIVSGSYFAYAGGYSAATQIVPGQAVWVKTTAAGHLYYSLGDLPIPPSVAAQPTATDAFAGLNKVVISDAAGGGTTLYFGSIDNITAFELPPLPPIGAFDARFATGHMVQTTKTQGGGNVSLPVAIQSVAYPVTVRWEMAAGNEYMLAAGSTSSIMKNNGSTTIQNPSVNRIVISGAGQEALPVTYTLFQNYPNPFNPSTNIKFGLPAQSRVNVEIYNLLGQKVRTLVNDDMIAGYHVVEWNGRNDANQQLSSGVYMLKITAFNGQAASFSDVQKLMLVK